MNNTKPYRFLYRALNVMAGAIFVFGFIAFLYIFLVKDNMFDGLAIFIFFSWVTVFISYFTWATYFYNINHGWTDKDWDKYFEALERKKNGEYVLDEELDAPKKNPYWDQTFGFPSGTVRGMIALTLLFGAISLIVASFGEDGNIASDAFYWDHFEFFKTAFLMMIAFYFGNKSLKYLQNRSNAAREKVFWENKNSQGSNEEPQEQSEEYAVAESESVEEVKITSLGASMDMPVSISSHKKALAKSEAKPNPTGLIPIIDAGHGGLDKNGKYLTAPSKMYTFNDLEFDYPGGVKRNEIYEGVINRNIAQMLIELLDENKIDYYERTVKTIKDESLGDRVRFANEKYKEDRNAYFLSIHSNAGPATGKGEGSKARGFEIFTSKGQTKSDQLADIAAKWYKKEFQDFKFRQDMVDGDADKEADFYVLRKTACPAFLVENLFFNNPEEAEFLMSESGQMRIATCLFKIVKEIYETQNNGLS